MMYFDTSSPKYMYSLMINNELYCNISMSSSRGEEIMVIYYGMANYCDSSKKAIGLVTSTALNYYTCRM